MPALSWEELSPEVQHKAGLLALEQVFDRLGKAEQARDAWQLHETSRLAEDNAATSHYRKMTVEVDYQIASALDHLRVVRALAPAMPPFAPYSLVRSSIESSALGIWLQSGGTTDKRVIRLLQTQWSHRLNVNTYTLAEGAHTQTTTDWLDGQLTMTKNERGGLRQRDFKVPPPSTTNMLMETDKQVPRRTSLSGLAAWRACSGVTHGNHNFSHALLNERTVTLTDGTQSIERTTSTSSLAMMMHPAIEYLEHLLALLIDHSQPRQGRPAR